MYICIIYIYHTNIPIYIYKQMHMQDHTSDLNPMNVTFTREQQIKFDQYVQSTRVRYKFSKVSSIFSKVSFVVKFHGQSSSE